jgi:hypothetical protein
MVHMIYAQFRKIIYRMWGCAGAAAIKFDDGGNYEQVGGGVLRETLTCRHRTQGRLQWLKLHCFK